MATLAQTALDLVVAVESRIANGLVNDRQNVLDLCAAVQALAQNALGSTPSSTSVDPAAVMVDASTTTPLTSPQE